MPGEAGDDCLIAHDGDQVAERHGEGLYTVESLGDFTCSANAGNLVLALNTGRGPGSLLAGLRDWNGEAV